MRRIAIIVLALLVGVGSAYAQTPTPTRTPAPNPTTVGVQRECGNGLPCGQIPWRLPSLPRLVSPTPFPTANPSQVAASIPTATVTPQGFGSISPYTPAPIENIWDSDAIGNQIGTLDAAMSGTSLPVYNGSGTPVDRDTMMDSVLDDTQLFFSYAKGFQDASFGSISPLVTFSLTALMIVLFTKVLTIALPVIMVIVGFIRRIIELILDFIPF